MGHAPPRGPKPAHPYPSGGHLGYYPPVDPRLTAADRVTRHQALRLVCLLVAVFTALVGFATDSPPVYVIGSVLALCAVLSPPSPEIAAAARHQKRKPSRSRWLSEPPLAIEGVSESDVRTYHAAAVTALLEDVTTPAQFEAALDRLRHDPEKALAETRTQMAPERHLPPPGRGGWQKRVAPPSEEARARLRGLPPRPRPDALEQRLVDWGRTLERLGAEEETDGG